MKSTTDIITDLFPFINVVGITSLIDGEVYRQSRRVDSQLNDVVIGSIANNNSRIQEVNLVINGFVKNLDKGMPDEATLSAIEEAIVSILETLDNDGMFSIMVVNTTQYPDVDRDGWWYTSIRFVIEVPNITLKT